MPGSLLAKLAAKRARHRPAASRLLGTQAGAPWIRNLRRKAWITTAVAAVLWAVIVGIILSGAVTVDDIDLRGWLPAPE